MKNLLIIEDLTDVADWLATTAAVAFPESKSQWAANLKKAREILKTTQVDLALIDIGLPDGDGTELISEIKQRYPACFCVMTTIFDDPGHLFPALRAGADGYLLKDDEEPVFVEALKGIVAGRPPLSAAMARLMLEQFRTPVSSDCDSGEASLTPREEQMLVLIGNGYSVRQSSESLGISHHTAAGYLKTLYQKLQVSNRAEATLKAVQMGLLNADR